MYMCVLSTTLRLLLMSLNTLSVSPSIHTQAQSLHNDTLHIFQQASNGTQAPSMTRSNEALSLMQVTPDTNIAIATKSLIGSLASSQNFLPYNVPHSPITILFYNIGPELGLEAILQTITGAISIAFGHVADRQGSEPIANGFFKYTHLFPPRLEVTFAVGDFREVGRPMTYYVLSDLIRGIGDFMMLPGQRYTEARFEVEQRGVGYVGSGYIAQEAAGPTSTAHVQ